MTSWRRWGSSDLNGFVRPGDIVTPTGNAAGVLKEPNTFGTGWRLLGNEIALVIATSDIHDPVDDFNIRWLFIMSNTNVGWCAATSVQALEIE